jgi:hypothetical protein
MAYVVNRPTGSEVGRDFNVAGRFSRTGDALFTDGAESSGSLAVSLAMPRRRSVAG